MPVTRRCRPGTIRVPCRSLASALYRMSLTSVDFPDPETPVTAMKQPSGNATSTFFRLCSVAPLTTTSRPRTRFRRTAGSGMASRPVRYGPGTHSPLARRAAPPLRAHGRQRDGLAASQVRASQRLPAVQQLLDRAGHNDLAAVLAGPRADVDDPVGRPDGVLVVLHHDQRVAQVPQPDQG